MFFQYPSLVVIVILATFPALLGFFLWVKFQDAMALITALWIYLTGGYGIVGYLAIMFADYERNREYDNTKPAPKINEPLHYKNMGEYPQAVPLVHFDARRNFANIVLARIEHGYAKVDLTETYWLVHKPRKWMGKDEEFRAMMHEWEGDVLERKNPNNPKSSYIVRNVMRLRAKAEGR